METVQNWIFSPRTSNNNYSGVWSGVKLWIFVNFIVILPFITTASDDYYTSLVGLHKLTKVEQQIVSALNEYVTSLEGRLDLAKKYLSDYQQSVLPAMSEDGDDAATKLTVYDNEKDLQRLAEKVSSHPLMTYRLIRRYSKELVDFEKDFRQDYDKKFLRVMEKIRKGMLLPKPNDVKGSIEGLLRLQDAYNIDISDFSKGNFFGLRTNSELLAVDCYHVGVYSLKSNVYTRAIEWLEQAYVMTVEENDTSIDSQTVYNSLQEAIHKHNEELKKVNKNPYTYRQFVNTNLTDKGKRVRVLDTKEHQLYLTESTLMDFTNFAALCAGSQLRTPQAMMNLKCWYENKFPKFVLSPYKVEMHHRHPPIFQIYDVLSDKMIETILKKATPSMTRSKVQGTLANKEVSSAVRTSTTTWMPEIEDPILYRIPQIIEDLTSLKVTPRDAAEDLQISSYGIGGHYNPHYDTLFDPAFVPTMGQDEISMGDRLATFMLYLSDVQRGGGTAFPKLGVVSRPIKGSAIFWYNMLSDGEQDPFSLHGGCPVLVGNKWVANKWIRYNAQTFTKPCAVRYDN